jgi:hypothetical protein
MATETETKVAKPAPVAKRVKPAKTVTTPRKAAPPRKAPKAAEPALAKPLSTEQFISLFKHIKGANSVELKLSVPLTGHRATIKSIGLDPVEAQPRHVYFFDTADQALNRAGLIVRARRIQGESPTR